MSSENIVENEMAPIFLELGKALFICQSLEVSLRFLNAQLSHDEADGEEGAFGSSLDFYSNETLGQSINNLRKRIDIPADLSDYLESGLKIRNEIVHDSMTKNIQRFAHPKGRLEVESELAFMKHEVKKRSVLVNKLLDALFAKDEFSNADFKRNVDELWAFVNETSGATNDVNA
jgi:hypothetical protein